MTRSSLGLLFAGALLTATTATSDDAVKNDRKRIEGTWRVVALEVNGHKATEADAKKLTLVNAADGTWALHFGGQGNHQGDQHHRPHEEAQDPQLHADRRAGAGQSMPGVFRTQRQNSEDVLRPLGMERPTEFTSTPGGDHILVTFERDKAK